MKRKLHNNAVKNFIFFIFLFCHSIYSTASPLKSNARSSQSSVLIFDLPLTYNGKVSYWVNYFQTRGASWFDIWLERSFRYVPMIQKDLREAGLPTDLAYLAMVESGFALKVRSQAGAVGPWQFMRATGARYGLHNNAWLDERRDIKKSTRAAIRYFKDLYRQFGSWYLVAAAYNMGENGLLRMVKKYKTRDYWELARRKLIPKETAEYVPKILAAIIIAKAPSLYGFQSLTPYEPAEWDTFMSPGGLDINHLADYLNITRQSIHEMNSELLLGYVPSSVEHHWVRVPKGSLKMVIQYLKKNFPQKLLAKSSSHWTSSSHLD